MSTCWQWPDRSARQPPERWCSADPRLPEPSGLQALLLCVRAAHSPVYRVLSRSISMVLLPSLLSVTLNVHIFLTAYPSKRSSFLLYSSRISAWLHTFTSSIHPEKSVPRAQQARLIFAEVSEIVHTYTPTVSLGQIAQFLAQPS